MRTEDTRINRLISSRRRYPATLKMQDWKITCTAGIVVNVVHTMCMARARACYYYDLLRQLAAQIKKKTYIHKTTAGND